jgi:arylsulfatase A-like enzyme
MLSIEGGRAESAGGARADGSWLATSEIFAAALGVAAADGSRAVRSLASERIGLGARVSTFAVAASIVLGAAALVMAVVLIGARWSASTARRGPRTSADALRSIGIATACAIAAARASIVGRSILVRMAPAVAAPILVLVTLGLIAIAITAAVVVTGRLAAIPALGSDRPAGAFLCRYESIALLVIAYDALTTLLPNDGQPFLPSLAWGVVALAAFRVIGRSRFEARFLRRSWLAVGALAALGVAGWASLPHLAGRARVAVYYRTGFAGTLASLTSASRGSKPPRSELAHAKARPPGPASGEAERVLPVSALSPAPALGAHAADESGGARSDLVVIHLDTVRADHVGFSGKSPIATPNLDRFRAGATWFKNAYTASPSTRYAMGSIFTGLDGARVPFEREGTRVRLLPQAETLAERLSEVGFDTQGVTFPYVTTYMPGFEQGFQGWESAWAGEPARASMEESTTRLLLSKIALHDARQDGRPLFLYAHYMCGHEPYLGSAGDALDHRYAETLAHCDAELGPLLDGLMARRRAAETTIVVLSDHGEMLGEHGLSFHGTALYEPLVRVPLLVRWASGKEPRSGARPPTTVETNVSLVDLAPALLALVGAPPLDDARVDRVGAAASGRPGTPPADEPVFFFTDDHVGLVRVESEGVLCGGLKFVRDLTTGAEQLVSLDGDPDETADIRLQMASARDALALTLDRWRGGEGHRFPCPPAPSLLAP